MDVTACFDGQSEEHAMTDGKKMLQLPEVGWLDFLDANTVYVSVRQDLAAAQVHDNVIKGVGLTKRTRALLSTLPADRALTFVVDGTGDVEWPGDLLPKGSDAAASLQVADWGVAFDFTTDVKSEAEAKALEANIKPQLAPLFANSNDSVGKLTVERTKTTVKISGKLSTLMMGIVSATLASRPVVQRRPMSSPAPSTRPLVVGIAGRHRLGQDDRRAQARRGDAAGPLRR